MKKKEKENIKLKPKEELRNLLKESEDLLFKLKIEKSQNKLKNLRSIFSERKKIALILTIINEKEILEKLNIKTGKEKVDESK